MHASRGLACGQYDECQTFQSMQALCLWLYMQEDLPKEATVQVWIVCRDEHKLRCENNLCRNLQDGLNLDINAQDIINVSSSYSLPWHVCTNPLPAEPDFHEAGTVIAGTERDIAYRQAATHTLQKKSEGSALFCHHAGRMNRRAATVKPWTLGAACTGTSLTARQ